MTVNEYVHEDGRSSFGAAAGSQMDAVLAADPAWTLASEADAPAADDPEDDGLDAMTRTDLNAKALKAGVKEPEKLPNKQAVIDAIRGDADPVEDEGDEDE